MEAMFYFFEKRAKVTMAEKLLIEKWAFMLLIAVLGFMCARELNRLSQSIENLTKSQTDTVQLYQELRTELKLFEAEMRNKK